MPQLAAMRWDMRVEGGEQDGVDKDSFLNHCADWYRRTLASDHLTHFVATWEAAVVATISVHRVEMLPRPCKLGESFGCIVNNYTRPEHRGRRVATRLLAFVKDRAREQDFELLIVWPSERAVPYYARGGFEWDNEVMELRLRNYVPITREALK